MCNDHFSYRNRSIHGDLVVVQILPESEWKEVSKTLKVAGIGSSSDNGHAVPTGIVVGVLSRRTYDIVASFPVSRPGSRSSIVGVAFLINNLSIK